MSASVCPLCLGQGYVIDLRASSTSATCRGCNGKGIVFPPPTDDTTDDELGLLRLPHDQRATIARLRADVARLKGANEDQYAELQQLSELRNADVARLSTDNSVLRSKLLEALAEAPPLPEQPA